MFLKLISHQGMNSYLENDKSKWSICLDSHLVNGVYLWIVIYKQYNYKYIAFIFFYWPIKWWIRTLEFQILWDQNLEVEENPISLK